MKPEILYGINPVHEALKAGRRQVETVFVTPGRPASRIQEVVRLAQGKSIEIRQVQPGILSQLAENTNHQGIAARVSPFPVLSLDEILASPSDTRGRHFLLLLDSLTDPQNLGALIRTAFCAGVDGVVLPKDRSVSPTPTVSRASAGALEHIRIARVVNMVQTIETLKKKSGIWVAGLDKDANQTIYDIDWTVPIAIVVGSEGRGIRELVRSHCDMMATIPQAVPFNSLNASVAGALVMYEVFRQRSRRNHE